MSTDLFRVVYCSRNSVPAAQGDPQAEVARILATSRANNARDGVTGALLYSNGCFAQVLEGKLAAVQRTFERIQRDPRHRDVIMLEATHIQVQLFGAWDMALAEHAEPAKAMAILSRVLATPNDDAGATVVSLLDNLVRHEGDWAMAAA